MYIYIIIYNYFSNLLFYTWKSLGHIHCFLDQVLFLAEIGGPPVVLRTVSGFAACQASALSALVYLWTYFANFDSFLPH